ncbi:endolytic transglycosylase MltG [Aneurinibacillus sp. Ricciae_BoGa-3]|uniref:endolytic transglycosylase MltG n=1 Tax=Aneurinibacillus sp. Ricciae_BoGa-3 TaxID=3022697 RepID=UPI0023425D3C|nr:endolytic transglycosylase MltG [Aneurinibacillus sp. Ricciae_BoGa-3]WCK53587.1 endolytic transglycosylase MltG [Aneurinibacillus sp. Ricciae_BoGa-3]
MTSLYGRRTGRVKVLVILGIILLVLVGGGGFYIWSNLQPVSNTGEQKVITIPPRTSTKQVGKILEENHLIRNAQIFALYSTAKGLGAKIKAGKYKITVGDSIDSIVDRMAAGRVYDDSYTVTIPEGYTLEQIAERVAEKGVIPKTDFIKEADKGIFSEELIKNIPSHLKVKHRLEGYLFPDTYHFSRDEKAHDVIDEMLKRTDQVWKKDWDSRFKAHKLTRHQALTLASIIEREVRSPKERPIVAGVFYNRLAKGMPLQADATLQYLFGKQKQVVTYADLKINSPYNTYKNTGLPPGPIASPGIASIEAAANPQKSQYLYYVTKKDGTGEHYFAVTYQDHLKNIARSNQHKK